MSSVVADAMARVGRDDLVDEHRPSGRTAEFLRILGKRNPRAMRNFLVFHQDFDWEGQLPWQDDRRRWVEWVLGIKEAV